MKRVIQFPKVRITDNRPTRAGARSPLDGSRSRTNGGSVGLECLTTIQQREAAEHDRAVRDYEPETVEAAFMDLAGRPVSDRKNPEHRWIMNRRAALRRLALSMRERGLA